MAEILPRIHRGDLPARYERLLCAGKTHLQALNDLVCRGGSGGSPAALLDGEVSGLKRRTRMKACRGNRSQGGRRKRLEAVKALSFCEGPPRSVLGDDEGREAADAEACLLDDGQGGARDGIHGGCDECDLLLRWDLGDGPRGGGPGAGAAKGVSYRIVAVLQEGVEGGADGDDEAYGVGVHRLAGTAPGGAQVADEVVGEARGEIGEVQAFSIEPLFEGAQGAGVRSPGMGAVLVGDEGLALGFPVEAGRYDAAFRLGRELAEDDGLHDGVDLLGREVLELGHRGGELGDALCDVGGGRLPRRRHRGDLVVVFSHRLPRHGSEPVPNYNITLCHSLSSVRIESLCLCLIGYRVRLYQPQERVRGDPL